MTNPSSSALEKGFGLLKDEQRKTNDTMLGVVKTIAGLKITAGRGELSAMFENQMAGELT